MIVPNFEFDTNKFNEDLNRLCEDGFSCLEAIIHWCEENSIDIETIVPFIKKDAVLKARLMTDADSLHMLKKTTKILEM